MAPERTPVKKQVATPVKGPTPSATGLLTGTYEPDFQGFYEWEINASDEKTTNELSALLRQRDQVNMKVVRVQKALAAARNRVTLPLLKTYMKNIEAAYTEFSAFHSKAMAILPKEMWDRQEEVYMTFENRFNFVNATIEELMLAYQQPSNVPAQHPQQQPQVVIQQQPLKVPIPTFNGDYAAWPKFKAIFEYLMANSPDSDAIKLYHLDKALVGTAAGVLDAKIISEGNYQQAWAVLTERFENKRIIVETHIRGLFGLQKMTSETYKELRRLLDECVRHVESLKYLGQNIDGASELFVIHLLTNAMDKATRKAWESTQKKGELPKYEQTISFLQSRCQILENCEMAVQTSTTTATKPKVPLQPKFNSPKVHAAAHTSTSTSAEKESCLFCNGLHPNYQCVELGRLPYAQRMEKVRSSGVCFNCLRKGHSSKECQSTRSCRKCQKRHHSLLHNDEGQRNEQVNVSAPKEQPKESPVAKQVSKPPTAESSTSTTCSCNYVEPSKTVFLLTAVVNAVGKDNQPYPCRVLLDSGSQVNFVTDKLAKVLGLPKQRVSIPIAGIGNVKTFARERMLVKITSRLSDFEAQVDCLVTTNVTGTIPASKIDVSSWNLPFGVELADPEFYQPDRIDMLIGAELFFELLRPGSIKTGDGFPQLRETHLGWVVAGALRAAPISASCTQRSFTATLDNFEESMQRFWMLEEVPESSQLTEDEEVCENHFVTTHKRDNDGRYIVKLPFKDNVQQLSDCRGVALKRFHMLERRLQQNPELKEQYIQFMREYQELGHCREVREEDDPPNQQSYYLPHHAVLRPSSSTTKCRVVFDASAKPSTSSSSLNEVLQVGAVVQSDLFTTMLRFRKYRYAFTADISKMYRQVRMDPDDARFQRIFWREDPSHPLRVMELTTVTYGTASAPFLATRCLQQLAKDEATEFPVGSRITKEDFYVDDVLSGADTLPEAIEASTELEGILGKGGFPIHKWCSNSKEFLEHIPKDKQESPVTLEEYGPNGLIKVLGLLWEPEADELLIAKPTQYKVDHPITKRMIYSEVAKLFDPLGLVAPVVVVAKLLVQNLWKRKTGWDDPVDDTIERSWIHLANSLPALNNIHIPRRVTANNAVGYEIHGFADASSAAYGACIYIRSLFSDGTAETELLCSKSKVAPLHDLSMPRKELCAALLLTRLLQKVIPAMKMTFSDVVLWSDSQIVLAWMKKPADRLKVFVRNRIHEINSSTVGYRWCYVRSKDNPADIVSRGQLPNELSANSLWWSGPAFLKRSEYAAEEVEDIPCEELPETTSIVTSAPAVSSDEFPIFSRYSSFRKLQRIVALLLRFKNNALAKDKAQKVEGWHVTVAELRQSTNVLLRKVQQTELAEEISRLRSNKPCRRIGNLNPVLIDGLLRVGGRLQLSAKPFESRNPIILPNRHPLTKMLIRDMHQELLHIGPSGLIAAIRQRYWLLSARSTVRQVTRGCVRCFRTNPTTTTQQMGNLPPSRITPSPPFAVTGVDYAGPFWIKAKTYRTTTSKAYIAVFVCMATKAVHLEAVSDLSTDAFIAALQRFTSKRGVAQRIYSDNATNFRGAQHELHQLFQQFQDQQSVRRIEAFCQPQEIEWHFIPPNAPEFGGLWEAAVKSTKRHLVRVVGDSKLTYEEMTTVLAQIEAILNSRPLFALSLDPCDSEVITPAHYLIGRPLTAIPEPSLQDIHANRLNRWQYLQKLREDFWKSWSRDYVSSLHPRTKNTTTKPNLRPGMIVLLEDKNLPPLSWKLGRIIKVFPGTDGLVRAVDVLSNGAVYRRPVTRLAVLPIEDNEPPRDAVETSAQPGGECSVPDGQANPVIIGTKHREDGKPKHPAQNEKTADFPTDESDHRLIAAHNTDEIKTNTIARDETSTRIGIERTHCGVALSTVQKTARLDSNVPE